MEMRISRLDESLNMEARVTKIQQTEASFMVHLEAESHTQVEPQYVQFMVNVPSQKIPKFNQIIKVSIDWSEDG